MACIIENLKMRHLKPRVVKWPTQGHTASNHNARTTTLAFGLLDLISVPRRKPKFEVWKLKKEAVFGADCALYSSQRNSVLGRGSNTRKCLQVNDPQWRLIVSLNTRFWSKCLIFSSYVLDYIIRKRKLQKSVSEDSNIPNSQRHR